LDRNRISAHFLLIVKHCEGVDIRSAYRQMVAIPSILAFLLPLPAARTSGPAQGSEAAKRRREIRRLALSAHILSDIGMADYESPADDPRWAKRFDLER